MTNSLSESNQSLSVERSPAGVRSRSDLWKLSILIALSSLLVSIYSLILSDRLTPAATQADIDQAAKAVATELAQIYLSNRRFGRVGFIDVNQADESQIGLNSLHATLRLDGLIATQLDLPYIQKLVETDARDAVWLTRALASIQREQAGEPHGKDGEGGRLYELAKKMLARNWRAGQLVQVKIRFGRLSQAVENDPKQQVGSKMPLPDLENEKEAYYANRKFYKAHVPVSIAGNNKYEFMDLAEKVQFFPSSHFEELPDNVPASVLLLSAEFQSNERNAKSKKRIMSSCVALGGPIPKTPSSVFMLSFPHGFFSNFPNMERLLKEESWVSRGDTYEAFAGPVPGAGRMALTTIAKEALTPSQAAMLSFYHFLFSSGPEVKPARVKELLSQPLAGDIAQESFELTSSQALFNSALLKDTGAAKFALVKQSADGGLGQKTIVDGFAAKPFSQQAPPSSFPLAVAENGFVSLSSGAPYDEELIRSFFDELYQTNISGIETMEVADTVLQRTQSAIRQCTNEIENFVEEAKSLEKSIVSVEAQNAENVEETLPQMKDRLIILESELENLRERKKRLESLLVNAKLVSTNGRLAAKSTYEIASHMGSFVNKGVQKASRPIGSFLLNDSILFRPLTKPVKEEEIYEMTERPDDKSERSLWTYDKLKISDKASDDDVEINQQNLRDYINSKPSPDINKPLFVLLASRSLTSSDQPKVLRLRRSPFAGTGLKASQFCYFAPGCLQSQITPGVRLSILIRDLQSVRKGSAQNIESLTPRWCLDLGLENEKCPDLCGEIQIRTPLPADINLPSRYLRDPAGDEVPLIPPLPAQMM